MGLDKSIELYASLIEDNVEYLKSLVNNPHKDQFIQSLENTELYKSLYIDQVSTYNHGVELRSISKKSDLCEGCSSKHASSAQEINHDVDLGIGGSTESYFLVSLNNYFRNFAKRNDLECVLSNEQRFRMPDLKVRNKHTGEDIAYIELKCIFKPFVFIKEKFKKNNSYDGEECYSHSATLDSAGKLNRQEEEVKRRCILDKTIYVYWYDIPCIKGVFWKSSAEVYEQNKLKVQYERKLRAGDFENGKKTGNTVKTYIPLHTMNNFEELLNFLTP